MPKGTRCFQSWENRRLWSKAETSSVRSKSDVVCCWGSIPQVLDKNKDIWLLEGSRSQHVPVFFQRKWDTLPSFNHRSWGIHLEYEITMTRTFSYSAAHLWDLHRRVASVARTVHAQLAARVPTAALSLSFDAAGKNQKWVGWNLFIFCPMVPPWCVLVLRGPIFHEWLQVHSRVRVLPEFNRDAAETTWRSGICMLDQRREQNSDLTEKIEAAKGKREKSRSFDKALFCLSWERDHPLPIHTTRTVPGTRAILLILLILL